MEEGRRLSFATVFTLSAIALLSVLTPPVEAQAQPPMKLSLVIEGGGDPNGDLWFEPDEILIASVPILVNVTFVNNDTVNADINHNFRTEVGGEAYETPFIKPGESSQIEFWINETGEIPFWCNVPGHRQLGMEGTFIVGLVPGEAPTEQGIPLRAYWIGLIGIFAMIGVIVVAYFVIKAESRHHTDHREHKRRGLP